MKLSELTERDLVRLAFRLGGVWWVFHFAPFFFNGLRASTVGEFLGWLVPTALTTAAIIYALCGAPHLLRFAFRAENSNGK